MTLLSYLSWLPLAIFHPQMPLFCSCGVNPPVFAVFRISLASPVSCNKVNRFYNSLELGLFPHFHPVLFFFLPHRFPPFLVFSKQFFV